MFLDSAYALTPPPQGTGGEGQGGWGAIGSFLPLILIFVIFYFLLIRPQSKKAKEHKHMLDNLKKGDKIVTSGGIHGVIEDLEEDTVTVKIAENVKIKLSRTAVSGIRQK